MKKLTTLLISSTFLLFTAVSCSNNDDSNDTPTSATVTLQDSATLFLGNTIRLNAVVQPADAVITWSSSNPAVATISNGTVTSVSEGTTNIVATTQDGNFTDTTIVVVGTFNCNTNTPGWGESLGTVTWGNTSNTNINSGTTTITGTDGRPNQIWSGAVFASACAKGNATSGDEFNGGASGNFNADCRQSLSSFNDRATAITGDFFSWCAVVRFADQLCPYPWRVPTRQDFVDLDMNLGGTGQNGQATSERPTAFMPAEGTATNPQIGGTWGGSRFTGWSGFLTNAYSYYWSQSESFASGAFSLTFNASNIWPQDNINKAFGFSVRCVR